MSVTKKSKKKSEKPQEPLAVAEVAEVAVDAAASLKAAKAAKCEAALAAMEGKAWRDGMSPSIVSVWEKWMISDEAAKWSAESNLTTDELCQLWSALVKAGIHLKEKSFLDYAKAWGLK